MPSQNIRIIPLSLVSLLIVACAGDGSVDQSANGPTPMAMEGAVAVAALIDDLEDGNDEIIETTERSGSWYTYNDGTSSAQQAPAASNAFQPTAGGPNDSTFMAFTEGQGFTDWGAGMGLDLNGADTVGATKGTVDASTYAGVTFTARGNVSISVNLVVDEVLSESLGGLCVADGSDCDDTHQVIVDLKNDWTQYSVSFDSVIQSGWGKAVAFDPSRLVSIQFGVAPGETFQVAIDNVGFYSP